MYSRYHREMSRGNVHLHSVKCHKFHLRFFLPARFLGQLLLLFPAMSNGCTPMMLPENVEQAHLATEYRTIFTARTPVPEGSTLDILTFEDDQFYRLDSYKRIEDFYNSEAIVESTGGPKRVVFCLNGQRDRYDWADISSYSSLSKIHFDLEKERTDRLTMTGECLCQAGSRGDSVSFSPLACQVRIGSLSCDFSGTPYSSARIRNARAYLINVNATTGLIHNRYADGERIINVEMLNMADVANFSHQENILRDISGELGRSPIHLDARFLCYPHAGDDSSPATQCTRLVIEGEIDSETYFWPINIGGGEIIRKNAYTYDILIKRKGVSDPNVPISVQDADIKMTIMPWTEKTEYGVSF